MRTVCVCSLSLLVFGYLFYSFLAPAISPKEAVDWTMINVNFGPQQGDAHLLEFPTGEVFFIDVGNHGRLLLSTLKAKHISRIDKIVISHPHKDHYGGLDGLLDAGIPIGEVLLNTPTQERCKNESPWGCDWKDLKRITEKLADHEVPVRKLLPGQYLYQEGGVTLKTLYVFNPRYMPFGNGKSDMNDASALMLLQVGKTRALFTGDLNAGLGDYLAKYGKGLEADILKVPHHGADSVAPNAFFDRVRPSYAMVPAPHWLWRSERDSRVRRYLEAKGTKVFVNGEDGSIHAHLTPDGLSIVAEQGDPLQPPRSLP